MRSYLLVWTFLFAGLVAYRCSMGPGLWLVFDLAACVLPVMAWMMYLRAHDRHGAAQILAATFTVVMVVGAGLGLRHHGPGKPASLIAMVALLVTALAWMAHYVPAWVALPPRPPMTGIMVWLGAFALAGYGMFIIWAASRLEPFSPPQMNSWSLLGFFGFVFLVRVLTADLAKGAAASR